MNKCHGIFYGIGAGPGDPELLTLKSLNILKHSDILIYPTSKDNKSLVREIVSPYLYKNYIEIPIHLIMGESNHSLYYNTVEKIKNYLNLGKKVTFLCEGDPFFYGSFIYIFQSLKQYEYTIQVVPGINSISGCASQLNIPIAMKNDVVSVIPANLEINKIKQHIEKADCSVIIKIGKNWSSTKFFVVPPY